MLVVSRAEPNMLKILPILFLPELPKILTHSYFIPTSSPIIPTHSCNFYCILVITMYTIHTVTIEQDIASADFSSESSYMKL